MSEFFPTTPPEGLLDDRLADAEWQLIDELNPTELGGGQIVRLVTTNQITYIFETLEANEQGMNGFLSCFKEEPFYDRRWRPTNLLLARTPALLEKHSILIPNARAHLKVWAEGKEHTVKSAILRSIEVLQIVT